MEVVSEFIAKFEESLKSGSFVKLTLSKPISNSQDLKNVYVRQIELKGEQLLSFTMRYATRDEVKNHTFTEGIDLIGRWLGTDFLNGYLFTLEEDRSIQFSRKRKARLLVKPPSHQTLPNRSHDKQKDRLIKPLGKPYLQALGITNKNGAVVKSGQKKWRQINKYIEIVDGLIRQADFPRDPQIVDMGSGKGYLTFALYDHLQHNLGLSPHLTGIELRQHLVDLCNEQAQVSGFDQLEFIAADIQDFHPERIDMLIALHACDIATDIAIAKGIHAKAGIIVVAPCCHKQVRKQMNAHNVMESVLKHGILEERQAELLTDGIRALLMEAHGYDTKVFEFISTEHTAKNLMIVGVKREGGDVPEKLEEVARIKAEFGIAYHYLERLL